MAGLAVAAVVRTLIDTSSTSFLGTTDKGNTRSNHGNCQRTNLFNRELLILILVLSLNLTFVRSVPIKEVATHYNEIRCLHSED